MKLTDIAKEAWAALRFHSRRSILTMLGMSWGIATVVLLLAYGKGLERTVEIAFEAFGTKVIMLFPGRTSEQSGGQKAGVPVRFVLDDVDYLKSTVPLIRTISPEVGGRFRFTYGARFQEFDVGGVWPNYGNMRKMELSEGRWLSPQDELGHARVVVIGWEVKKRLFSETPALGESLRIAGLSFTVVGILSKKVQIGDTPDNRKAFIPFATMSQLRDTRYLGSIVLEPETASAHTKMVKAIRESLGARYRFKPTDRRAVFVFDVSREIEEIHIITTALRVLLAFIGTLTLAIGGVGVMNIMLVSVMQRTREIGTEISLGARRRHILGQFLAEALLFTFAGGLVGIGIAYFLAWVVGPLPLWSAFMEEATGEGDIVLRISGQNVLTAFAILSFIGIVSGMWPALRASRLDPVEALRYE